MGKVVNVMKTRLSLKENLSTLSSICQHWLNTLRFIIECALIRKAWRSCGIDRIIVN